MAKRDKKGRVVAGGGSLNPGGRPVVPPEVRETFRAAMPKAAKRLVKLIDSFDEKVALSAIEVLLTRVLGKPGGAMDDDKADADRPLVGLSTAQLLEIVRAGNGQSEKPDPAKH